MSSPRLGGASSPRVDRTWFQLLRLRCDEPLSNFAFEFYVRPCTEDEIKEGLAAPVQKFCDNSHRERAPRHRPRQPTAPQV